jgi:hypothetical protein
MANYSFIKAIKQTNATRQPRMISDKPYFPDYTIPISIKANEENYQNFQFLELKKGPLLIEYPKQ